MITLTIPWTPHDHKILNSVVETLLDSNESVKPPQKDDWWGAKTHLLGWLKPSRSVVWVLIVAIVIPFCSPSRLLSFIKSRRDTPILSFSTFPLIHNMSSASTASSQGHSKLFTRFFFVFSELLIPEFRLALTFSNVALDLTFFFASAVFFLISERGFINYYNKKTKRNEKPNKRFTLLSACLSSHFTHKRVFSRTSYNIILDTNEQNLNEAFFINCLWNDFSLIQKLSTERFTLHLSNLVLFTDVAFQQSLFAFICMICTQESKEKQYLHSQDISWNAPVVKQASM